jgi:hypothetical protein
MKIIQKHHTNRRNETGVVIIYPQETNQLLVKDFKYIAFSSTEPIGYRFSKTEQLNFNSSFSIENNQETFFISNTSPNEIRVQYSCIH